MLALLVIAMAWVTPKKKNVLVGKVICLDPGHGGTADTDQYRVGPSGEREEWVNLRVAHHLKKKLEGHGAKVVMTRTEDVLVSLERRSEIALNQNADLFLSIHHNATADTSVNFPIVYFHGSANENHSSVAMAKLLAERFRDDLFKGSGPISVVSDFTIFPQSGTSVLRGTYGIPGAVAEASFFSNPSEEKRLMNEEYNELEAQAYFLAISDYFKENQEVKIHEKLDPQSIPVFPVYQEADRMNPEALRWKVNVTEGKQLFDKGRLDEAFERFTLSVKSFPDSYLAREAHEYRAKILKRQDKHEEAEDEERRVKAFYPAL